MLLISSQSLSCPFQAWVLSGAPYSSMQASCHLGLISCSLGRTMLELEGGDIWKEEVIPLVSRPISHGFLQEDPWTGQSLLPWCPELWFYCLPCPLLSKAWTLPSRGHCSQSCPQTFTLLKISFLFVSIISSRAPPLYPYPAPRLYPSIAVLQLCELSHHISVIPISALHLHVDL